MGKYSLGKSKSTINEQITKENLFIDEKRCKKLQTNIDKNLELIEKSMINIERLLNKSLSMGAVSKAMKQMLNTIQLKN